eukprot:scaffold15919_cov33-Phaeocystis_antarctica.AAC.1
MLAPPLANDWFYRDLEGTVQGPFTEAQISEWHTAGYLPADLQMRTADEPDSAYIALSELMTRDPNGEPPFLKMHRERIMYEAERERLKAQWEQMKTQDEERKRARAAAEEEKRLQRAHALEQQRLQQEQLNAQRLALGPLVQGLPPPPGKGLPPPPGAQQLLDEERRKGADEQQRLAQEHAQIMAAQEAQRQAEAEMHRKMIDDARRQAEEEARVQVEEARRQTEMMQMQMQAQAEQLARQQAEVQAQQQQQQQEMARRQAAMEEQQGMARRQAEELVLRQANLVEQERQLSMLPPANAPGAGNALLSLLQSSDGSLPQQQQLDTSSLDALWAQDMPGGSNGEAGFGRGRGRGRGVCSAALGTGAQRPKFGRGSSGDSLGLDGLQLDQPGGLPGMGEPPSGGGAHLAEPDADDKGRKKKNKKDK